MDIFPTISVIVTSFNKSQYLKTAVESVLNQNYPINKIDLIVVDDCSTDDSRELISDYLKNYSGLSKVIKHSHNQGTAAARNTGIANSKSNSVAFQMLDGDDWLETDCLLDRATYLLNKPQIGMVYSDFRGYNETTKTFTQEYRPHFSVLDNLQEYICGTNCLITRNAIEAVGLYSSEFPTIEDYEISIRISRFLFIEHICANHYVYRHNENQKTTYMVKNKIQDLNNEYAKLHIVKQKLFGDYNKR
jgi:glycosyltransferase involved in cell wall biosynthesis